MKTCPRCNKEAADDAMFCSSCGYSFKVTSGEASRKSKVSGKWQIGFALLIVFAVAVGFWLGAMNNDESENKVETTDIVVPAEIERSEEESDEVAEKENTEGNSVVQPTVTFSVSYHANNGKNVPDMQMKEYGESVKISEESPTRIGYAFVGWNTNQEGTGSFYTSGEEYKDNADLVLYAIWEPLEIKNIVIASGPAKSKYIVGDAPELDGLSIDLIYSDGSSNTVTDGFSCLQKIFPNPGIKPITVMYEGFTASVDVEVAERTDSSNILTANVDGKKKIFYLEETKAGSDGYEISFTSFNDDCSPDSHCYLRIDSREEPGIYSNENGFRYSAYFSISTKYDVGKDSFSDSYVVIDYSSKKTETYGTYELCLNQKIADSDVISGTMNATMRAYMYSNLPKDATLQVSNLEFHCKKGETHPVVLELRKNTQVSDDGNITGGSDFDIYDDEDGYVDTKVDHTCRTCKGSGECTGCAGRGWKRSWNSYSGEYRLIDCVRCSGSGSCSVCYGTGKVY